MKKRYLTLLCALMMLASSTSCASEDSSSGSGSSAAGTSASTDASASAPAGTSGEVSEAPADELPAMDSACKVLDCLDVPGFPSEICSCGNIVAVQCNTVDGNNKKTVKYYIVDAVKDELLHTVDAGNEREILLGTDAEGNITAEIWKDVMGDSDDPQQLVFYKPDGTRTAVEYSGDLMFLKCDPAGQLCDLSKGVAKLGSDLSREVIFDAVEAEEALRYDPSGNRAVVSYLAASFTEPTTLMLVDTSTGKEITELEAVHVTNVDDAGDYIVVTCIPDYEAYDYYTSVYEKETGKLIWSWREDHEGMSYSYCDGSSYGLSCGNTEIIDPLTYSFLRVSDGATGTLDPGISDVFQVMSTSVTSADRIISAVGVGDRAKGDTRVKLVMIDPAQVNFDGEVEKCEPYEYNEKDNKCGEQFSDLRAKADKLEEKYGVRILIGDEVLDLEDTNDPYAFPSAEGEEAGNNSYRNTERGLTDLEKLLEKYPEGFFEQFKINGKAGLCIGLVESLVDKYSDTSFEAAGVTYGYGLWTVIAIRADAVGYALNHEMFHAVEFTVGQKVGAIDEDEWNALNPEGFGYSTDFDGYAEGDTGRDHVYGDDDDPYFYREYGKVTPLEDRATLIEGLFDNAESETYIKDIKEKYPHLKAKYDYLADWTKQLFGYVYWEKMLGIDL
ncbi:MAG: hypothetical protein IKP47_02825 [Ruminococcus sp.]|nr:hypothetical protein [Ruminococcus sp.]